MEIATILNLTKELDAYASGAKLLDKAMGEQKDKDLAWLEHEQPKAIGELVLICNDLLIPKVKKELPGEEAAQVEKMLLIASTVLARRAVEGK